MSARIAALAAAVILVGSAANAAEPLKFVASVPLNVEGRMDHLAYDPATQRVFIAALENRTVEVVDLKARKVVYTLSCISEPQGLVYIAEQNRLLVNCRGDGTTRSYDATTFAPGPWIDWGRNADNIRYDAGTRTVYVGSNGEPGTGTMGSLSLDFFISVAQGGKASPQHSKADFRLDEPRQADPEFQLTLPAHPESFQFDVEQHLAFVNVPDDHSVLVLSTKSDGIEQVGRWPVTAGAKNFPMLHAPTESRVYIATRIEPFLVGYDAKSGAEVSRTACVGDGDDMFFDAETRQLVLIGGEGFIDVFQKAEGADELTRTQHLETRVRARTGTFLADSKTLCVAVPHTEAGPAELRLYELK